MENATQTTLQNFDPSTVLESTSTQAETTQTDSSQSEQNNQKLDSSAANGENNQVEDFLELDSVSKKIKIGDETFTAQELKAQRMRQAEFTRKSQELAKEREQYKKEAEYKQKLKYDVAAVKNNPVLAEKFKEIYPEEYHFLVDEYAQEANEMSPLIEQQVQKLLDPHLKAFNEQKKQIEAQKQEVAEKKLASMVEEFSKKYEYADEEWCYARSDAVLTAYQDALEKGDFEQAYLIENKYNIKKGEQAFLESVFKESNNRILQRFEAKNSAKAKEIKNKQKQAMDVGTGGNVAGKDRKFETWDDIEAFSKSLMG